MAPRSGSPCACAVSGKASRSNDARLHQRFGRRCMVWLQAEFSFKDRNRTHRSVQNMLTLATPPACWPVPLSSRGTFGGRSPPHRPMIIGLRGGHNRFPTKHKNRAANTACIRSPARVWRLEAAFATIACLSRNQPREMKQITCIEDLREIARRKVPRAFFDYVEAGSYSQETLRANRADLEQIKFRQRVMVDVSSRETSTSILG